MTARHLTRCDPARNMARFYRLDVQPDLFGGWMLVREWGRIGRAGRTSSTVYVTAEVAAASLDHQQRVKERRGYQLFSTSGVSCDNSNALMLDL